MSAILRFSEANAVRMVITSWTGGNSGIISDDIDFKFFKEISEPFADAFYQPFNKTDELRLQFDSSFDTTNVLKLKKVSDDSIIITDNAIEVDDKDTFKIYEYEFDLSGVTEGEYYIEVSGTDADTSTFIVKSEPLSIKADHCGSVLIEYANNESAYGIEYSTAIEFQIRVPARFFKTANTSETEPFTDSGGRRSKIYDEITKARVLEIGNKDYPNGIPQWMIEKVNIALGHDYCNINGRNVSSENKLNHEYTGKFLWASPNAVIHLEESDLRNQFDSGTRGIKPSAPTNLTFEVGYLD